MGSIVRPVERIAELLSLHKFSGGTKFFAITWITGGGGNGHVFIPVDCPIHSSSVSSTVFLCLLPSCKFSKTKDGMTNRAAANHLKTVHKVNGKMMQNAGKDGRYKFRKAKKEHF